MEEVPKQVSPLGTPKACPPKDLNQCRTLQRHNTKNLKQLFPEEDLLCLSPNFHIHVSVSDVYILMMDLTILLEENVWTDSGNI